MSTISGNGSGQDEVSRRNREDYQSKEANLIKKHHKEIRRLNEVHMQELDRVRGTHDNQVQSLQRQSTNNVSRRDAKYQSEIEKIRKFHSDQIGKLKSDHHRQLVAERGSNRNKEGILKESNDERVRGLKNHYEKVIVKKDKDYTEQLGNFRKDQADAVTKQRKQLNTKHSSELEQLIGDRRKEKAEIQYKFNEHRETTAAEKKRDQINNLSAQRRVSDNSMAQLQRERRGHDDQITALRIGFQDSLRRTRDRFEKAAGRERELAKGDRFQLKAGVDQRMNSQVRQLELKNEDLKYDNNLSLLKQKQAFQREKSNITESFKDNIELYEKSREVAKDSNQVGHAEDLHELQRKNDEVVTQSTKFYLGRMREENFRNRSALSQLASEKKSAVDQSEMLSQKRVDVILKDTEGRLQAMRDYQKTSLDMMKEDYLKERTELVEGLSSEKEKALRGMRGEIQKREIAGAKKEADLRLKYKREVGGLNSRHVKEKRQVDNHHKLTIKSLAKSNQEALEMQQSQFSTKLDTVNHDHRLELDRMRSAHRAQMDSVLSSVKQSQA